MEQKKFNTTLTAVFPNDKFGEGSLWSKPVTDQELVNFSELKSGDRLLIKKSKKKSANGSSFYFVEILPPLETSRNRDDSEV